MAAGDLLLDADGNRILSGSGDELLSNGVDDSACCCGTDIYRLLNCHDDADSGYRLELAPASVADFSGKTVRIDIAASLCTYLDPTPTATPGTTITGPDYTLIDGDCTDCCTPDIALQPSSVVLSISLHTAEDPGVPRTLSDTEARGTNSYTGPGGDSFDNGLPFGDPGRVAYLLDGNTFALWASTFTEGGPENFCGWGVEFNITRTQEDGDTCTWAYIAWKFGVSPLGNYPNVLLYATGCSGPAMTAPTITSIDVS